MTVSLGGGGVNAGLMSGVRPAHPARRAARARQAGKAGLKNIP
jgi:hypothetical protein